jgi:polyisoprenoid-binding protein YceI
MIRIALRTIAALLLAAGTAFGANVTLSSGSRLWLEGDSTMHAYKSTATHFDVAMVVDDGPIAERIKAGGLRSLSARVPVMELKSGKDGLDTRLQKALKAGDNPDISFKMTDYDVLPSTDAGSFPIRVRGELTVAGRSKPIDLDATVISGDPVKIQGYEELLMTDYGVKPPSVLGAIRTRNEIVVRFDLLVK